LSIIYYFEEMGNGNQGRICFGFFVVGVTVLCVNRKKRGAAKSRLLLIFEAEGSQHRAEGEEDDD
jgi:hypothetical protein